jgi:hypothetical protein
MLRVHAGGQAHDVQFGSDALCDLGAIDETAPVTFEIPDPAPDVQYRLRIGREWLGGDEESATGERHAGCIVWPERAHFEGARGLTVVRLETSRANDPFTVRAIVHVTVRPGKLGMDRYHALYAALLRISPSLVWDVHGKSRRDFGASGIEDLTNAWSIARHALRHWWSSSQPALRPNRSADHIRNAWNATSQLADRRALALSLRRRAVHAQADAAVRGLTSLEQRLRRLAQDVGSAVMQIEVERPTTSVDLRGRSLFTLRDQPRLHVLDEILRTLDTMVAEVEDERLRLNPASHSANRMSGARVMTSAQRPPAFVSAILRAERTAEQVAQGGTFVKATSRLYEEWVFIRIAQAFAERSMNRDQLHSFRSDLARHRFADGIPRNTTLRFMLPHEIQATIMFEPWIRSAAAAREAGDDFCRDDAGSLPWSPDVLISIQAGGVARHVVVDAKYSSRLSADQWRGVRRYFDIRNVQTGVPCVGSVWIAAPLSSAAPPDDWNGGGVLPLIPGDPEPHDIPLPNGTRWPVTRKNRFGSGGSGGSGGFRDRPAGPRPSDDRAPRPMPDAEAVDGATLILRAFCDRLIGTPTPASHLRGS